MLYSYWCSSAAAAIQIVVATRLINNYQIVQLYIYTRI